MLIEKCKEICLFSFLFEFPIQISRLFLYFFPFVGVNFSANPEKWKQPRRPIIINKVHMWLLQRAAVFGRSTTEGAEGRALTVWSSLKTLFHVRISDSNAKHVWIIVIFFVRWGRQVEIQADTLRVRMDVRGHLASLSVLIKWNWTQGRPVPFRLSEII